MSIVSYNHFFPDETVRTVPQHLSEGQKAQARENIGAMSKDQQVVGGLTAEQAEKLGEIDHKVDQSQLQEAVDQALLQAQHSGKFNGKDGLSPRLSIGTVTTLAPDEQATAEITGTGENLKLNLGIPRGTGGGAPMEGIPIRKMNETTAVLEPNVAYLWGEVLSLNIQTADEMPGIYSEYYFSFRSGKEPAILELPKNIKWQNGKAPVIQPNKMYQITIVDGGALYAEF